jgi:hypothetical protein
LVAISDNVRTHGESGLSDGGQRINARDIDLVQLLDPAEDGAEFTPQARHLLIAQADARQSRNATHHGVVEGGS